MERLINYFKISNKLLSFQSIIKVDLDKVREIRKALRRRYANRKNF